MSNENADIWITFKGTFGSPGNLLVTISNVTLNPGQCDNRVTGK